MKTSGAWSGRAAQRCALFPRHGAVSPRAGAARRCPARRGTDRLRCCRPAASTRCTGRSQRPAASPERRHHSPPPAAAMVSAARTPTAAISLSSATSPIMPMPTTSPTGRARSSMSISMRGTSTPALPFSPMRSAFASSTTMRRYGSCIAPIPITPRSCSPRPACRRSTTSPSTCRNSIRSCAAWAG